MHINALLLWGYYALFTGNNCIKCIILSEKIAHSAKIGVFWRMCPDLVKFQEWSDSIYDA